MFREEFGGNFLMEFKKVFMLIDMVFIDSFNNTRCLERGKSYTLPIRWAYELIRNESALEYREVPYG